MQVSKKALVGSFVPVATNSKNSSMSPFRSRQRKEGSLSIELVRNSSSSLIRKDLSSSAIVGSLRERDLDQGVEGSLSSSSSSNSWSPSS